MADNAKRTGAALEAHYQLLMWLIPALEKFPKAHKFTLGDRTRRGFQLGDTVDVRLVEAVPSAGALRFEMLSDGQSGMAPASAAARSGARNGGGSGGGGGRKFTPRGNRPTPGGNRKGPPKRR